MSLINKKNIMVKIKHIEEAVDKYDRASEEMKEILIDLLREEGTLLLDTGDERDIISIRSENFDERFITMDVKSVDMKEVMGEWVIYVTGETERGLERTEIDAYDNLRQILVFIERTLKKRREYSLSKK